MTLSWTKEPARARREGRRRDAENRQAAHDALSYDEKMRKAHTRPGRSYAERDRLYVRQAVAAFAAA